MKYYIYKFSDNWADEMDLEGFAALNEMQKDIALAKIKREYRKGGTVCFGTNEDNEYDSLEDVLDCIEIEEISLQEYQVLHKLFSGGSSGELGPLDLYDLDGIDDMSYDQDIETCEECGEELSGTENEICEKCRLEMNDDSLEKEYKRQADSIVQFIIKEYGIEQTSSFDEHANFKWKPTSKTEIEIIIDEFDDGDEEVELALKLNGKELRCEFFNVDEIYDNPGLHLKSVIKEFIEKAKKY